MSNENGIRQTPFNAAWPAPDVSGTGVNGIGGGIDLAGADGIVNSPFDKAFVPTPGGQETPCADLGGVAPQFVQTTDAPAAGSQAPWDVTSSRNTVDRR